VESGVEMYYGLRMLHALVSMQAACLEEINCHFLSWSKT
jgi:hypothetical protein